MFKTDEELYRTISNNLKQFRQTAGLTQQELADKATISISYLTKIEAESCNKSLSISTLNQIANALNIEITEFLKEE